MKNYINVRILKDPETMEHIGKKKYDLSKLSCRVDKVKYNKAGPEEVLEILLDNPSKEYIAQGERLGYNPYMYCLPKKLIVPVG